MDERRFQYFLNDIADQLRSEDISKMKYLCSEKIEAGILHNTTSAREFFILLKNRTLIQPSNINFLVDLLNDCDRKDLVTKAQSTYDGVQVVPESGVALGSFTSNKQFKMLLNKLADELTTKDIESFKFLVDIPAGMAATITTGVGIFDFLEKGGQIGPSDISLLLEIFNAIHRKDLVKKVEQFTAQRHQMPGNMPLRIQSKPQDITPTRQPSTNSERLSMSPRPPLLTPEHFQPRQPFVLPSAPMITPIDEEDHRLPSYPDSKRPRGICLIFNNKIFGGSVHLQERTGTEKDVENLKLLWEKLHFNVVVKDNLSAHEMYDTARDFSRLDHSNYDCFVCCILSHGIQGGIYGSDGEVIEIGQITSQFKGTACRSLADKPKLFFVQACRGTDFDPGVSPDAVRNTDEEAMRHSAEPNEGHFLLGYATPPGYVSWRSVEHGSWYISHLCDVFHTHCERYDVMSMMVKVNDKVSEAFTKKGYKQCPAPVVTLRKRIYFSNN